MTHKILDEMLGIVPTTPVQKNEVSIIAEPKNKEPTPEEIQFEEDFEKSRQKINDVLDNADEAMQYALKVATASESAASFMALNGLLGTITASAKVLLDIHKSKRNFKKSTAVAPVASQGSVTNIQNGVVLQGTPNDLKNYIKNLNEKEEEIDSSPPLDLKVNED